MKTKTELANELLKVYEELPGEHKNSMQQTLEAHFFRTEFFSTDELMNMELEEIQTIKATIDGMLLTLEWSGQLTSLLENVKNENLPSSISFGRINPDTERG